MGSSVHAWGTSEGLVFQHGFLENAASHGYDGFTSLCSRPLLHNRRRSVGMLWRVSEKVTDAFSQWAVIVSVVTWWANNHVGVDFTQ